MEYCSSINTGADYNPHSDIYQSKGLCIGRCSKGTSTFAFAILQGFNCYCSDYIPEIKSDGCDENCPGYPLDKCGNTKKDLYGYYALLKKPLGTKGVETTTETKTPKSSSTSNEKSTSAEPQTTPEPTISSGKDAYRRPNITVVTTIGGFKTIVISPPTQAPSSALPSSSPEPSSSPGSHDGFFSSGARTAGLISGLLLLVMCVAGGIFFFRRRRNNQLAALSGTSSPHSNVIPAGGAGIFGRRRSRSLSTLGLIGEKPGNSRDVLPGDMQGSPNSSNSAPLQTNGGPNSTVGQVYDQRLDPGQVYLRFDPRTGSSRMSVRSLRDDQDYSRRVLRLANPDD